MIDPIPNYTVCLLGSPRRNGNSDTLAAFFLNEAEKFGASVETVALSELQYGGCINLFRCKTDLNHCGQTDALTPVLSQIEKAEVLVLASPIYFTSVTGQMKLALDRFFSFFVPDYPNAKVKSRLASGRHVVLLQTQGESEEKYGNFLNGFSDSLKWLGFDKQHNLRAWDTRNIDEIDRNRLPQECRELVKTIYGE